MVGHNWDIGNLAQTGQHLANIVFANAFVLKPRNAGKGENNFYESVKKNPDSAGLSAVANRALIKLGETGKNCIINNK